MLVHAEIGEGWLWELGVRRGPTQGIWCLCKKIYLGLKNQQPGLNQVVRSLNFNNVALFLHFKSIDERSESEWPRLIMEENQLLLIFKNFFILVIIRPSPPKGS